MDSYISSSSFLVALLALSVLWCQVQTVTVLLFSFQFVFIYFPCLIAVARSSNSFLKKVVRVGIFVFFLILEKMLSTFYHWVLCWLRVCHIWLLLCWGNFLLYPLCGEFLLYMVVEFLSKAFSTSTEMIIWFLFFSFFFNVVYYIDLWILTILASLG